MTGAIIYATYADGVYEANLRVNGWCARWLAGCRKIINLTRRDLEASPIYAAHRDVFDAPRGAGYWAWKPWAILTALDRAGPGDVVFYQDCGFGFRYKPLLPLRRLARLARSEGVIAGVRAPQYGPLRQWCRARCFSLMGCIGEPYDEAITVQATPSLWTDTPATRAFLEEWLGYCLMLDAIRDARDDERGDEATEFVEHRHDQAILSNLVVKWGAKVIDVAPATRPFLRSSAMVELDLWSRESKLAAALLHAITSLARVRRRRKFGD